MSCQALKPQEIAAVALMTDVLLASDDVKKDLASDLIKLLERASESEDPGDIDSAVALSEALGAACPFVREAAKGSLWAGVRDKVEGSLKSDVDRMLAATGSLEQLLETRRILSGSS